uniref:ORF47 n=1 Tax=Nitrosopumilaceae spindle-shaped virus TaxID=3065433 RepID=A0AAT9JH46_9VIRU
MNRNICIHEPTEIRLREGWNDDYYCPACKAYVGYFSRLIWRKPQ